MAQPTTHSQTIAEPVTSLDLFERAHRSEITRGWHRFRRYRPGLAGGVIVLALVLTALFAPILAPESPTEKVGRRAAAPSSEFLLGNDEIGRDVFSRLLYGTRVALIVGIGAMSIALVIGVTVGATAGYFGGKVDLALSRLIDTLMAFPLLALLITLAALFSPRLINVVIVIGVTVWASYARVVRADVLSLRERDFVVAARAIGVGNARIIARHMLPNVLGPIIVLASLDVGSIIILESALSFLGLGIQPPTPSWGGMLAAGRSLMRNAPHIAVAPGVAITITVLAFNLLGDGLRDALDPRQRE
ncbi:MAG: peptide/nickel transport system permease protein [Thermomicrobiales bacterium]|jgi:ABC-type dipeptide/oligopeptide/nickel transport system permease subunit|nr:peptide/nickel transport system permease protein [Thermomicrobiales bacterium]MEA2596001.1 peptide/nickel transport system permease protein [Thermomicrobiales bacterium]